jgi:hypothetical protein
MRQMNTSCMKGMVQSRMKWITLFIISLFCALIVPPIGGCPLLWSYSIEGITAVSVSDNGGYIAVGCEDGWYYIFDTYGTLVGSGQVPDAVVSLDIADTGDFILGFLNEYTFCTREGIQRSSVVYEDVRDVSISKDGLFSLACSNTNVLINVGTSMVQELDVSSEYPFGVMSSDGTTACAASDAGIIVFEISEYIDIWTYGAHDIIKHLFVSRNGKKIVFSAKNKITYMDVEKREPRTVDVDSSIVSMAATSTGDLVLAATESELIWLEGISIIRKLDREGIQFISLSEDGSLAITGKDSTFQVITCDGTPLFTYDVEDPITGLEMSWNQYLLVVCTRTSIYTFQLFEKTQPNTHVFFPTSRKILPLTSPLEEVWSLPITKNAFFYTGDVNGDGKPEIVLKEGTALKIIDGNGTILLEKDFKRKFGLGYLLDVDGDTICEIPLLLSATKFRFAVYEWGEDNPDYYYLDELNTGLALHNAEVMPLFVIDSNNDGNPEILAAIVVGYSCKPRGVASIDYASGDMIWFYQSGTGPMAQPVADINGDGSLEIVTGSMAPCTCPDDEEYPDCDSYVTALSLTGEELWNVNMGHGFLRITVSIEDINESEGTEIIEFGFNASENWGNISILNCNGEYLYNSEFDYSIIPGVVSDIDGDNYKEIIVADTRGYLTVYSGDLQEESRVFVTDDITTMAQVYANDFNGDGFLEVFLILEKKLFIFDKDLNSIWQKEFPEPVWWGIANFSQCKNTLLVASDKLYAYSYTNEDSPCPLWTITERTLTEKGTSNFDMAESDFAAGEYRNSKLHYETALDCFTKLEDRKMETLISEKIVIVSEIIFKQDIRLGMILLVVSDVGLCVFLVYSWFTRKWSRLAEGAFLLSLPVLFGLFQVHDAQGDHLRVFVTYAVPTLIGATALILRQNIIGFVRTVAAILSGHKDMLVLSIVKSEGSYKVSVESIEEKFRPVKESKEVAYPEETRENVIKKIEFMVGILGQSSSGTHKSLNYAEEILRENGKTLYKNFIPDDFSSILKAKFLLLEVEDPEIPWELMYSDDFFAVKYAISRRIVTTEPVNVQQGSKKRGKRALIISDPTETLPDASPECDTVYKRLKRKMNTTLLKGNDASARRVANLFGQEFDIIHFAGHVENGLVLSDGAMTPEEVKEFITGTPIIFVNGCKSEELAKAFLLGGAMAYVGTIHPVHDYSAADIAADFYDFCFEYRIGEALRRARLCHMGKNLVWASLVMYGDPTLKLL